MRIDKLQSFLKANRGVSLGAYLSTSYEVAAGFTDKAYEMLKATNASTVVFPKRGLEGPEKYYRKVFAASGYPLPQEELSNTMTFVRHRRNAIIHLSGTPNLAYRTFTSSLGPSLKAFWKSSKVEVDFTCPTTGPPSECDSLDLIKLLRVVTQKLDNHLASIINVPELIKIAAQELFGNENVRMNLLIREKRVPKLRAKLFVEFGFSGSPPALETAANTVGIMRPTDLNS